MRILAIAMLLLTGCVSASAGRASNEQQYPEWVRTLAERRASLADESRRAEVQQEMVSSEAGSGSAGEPAVEARAEPEIQVVVTAKKAPEPTLQVARTVASKKSRSEMTDSEKMREGMRLLREANAIRERAQRLMDEEEPRLAQQKQALQSERRQYP